ncbi:MAG: hypothetical protein ABI759_29460 [Candidatus Solibacter sp.]
MHLDLLLCCLALFSPHAGDDSAKTPVSDPPASNAPAVLSRTKALPPSDAATGGGDPAPNGPAPGNVLPVAPNPVVIQAEERSVNWVGLTRGGLSFIGVMHAFRLATEAGTRAGGFGLGDGYTSSVARLHGWADGDPFYVNYVGHPMQGAVANALWQINDRRFAHVEFGRAPDYWKSKLRGAAFAWAFSEQFEIGPLSEASIGHIQRDFPQQGLVDHVVTPSIGLAWSIGEDVLDRYVVRPIEDRTYNRWVRLAARGFLNPARSFANVLALRPPWYRTSRAGILGYAPMTDARLTADAAAAGAGGASPDLPAAAPFEFAPLPVWRQFGANPCAGGGGEAAWRFVRDWQLVATVSGCKVMGLPENVSADTLLYQIGPRWTPAAGGKWSPYAHLLIGGLKVTQERLDPAAQAAVLAANRQLDPSLHYTLHDQYTTTTEANALAVTAGIGVDYKLNSAFALRIANLEYLRAHAPAMGGVTYGQGFQMSAGMVLRLGTW